MGKISRVLLAAACGLLAFPFAGSAAPKKPVKLKLEFDKKPVATALKARTSFAPMIKRVAPSVVTIQAERAPKGRHLDPFFNDPFFKKFRESVPGPRRRKAIPSLGSGVIVTKDGYVLTNNHVIAGASSIKVVLTNKKRYGAEIIGTDQKTDLAVLKIEPEGELPAAIIGDSGNLEVGDMAFAFGNPFGVGQTVTRGMVSALGRGNLGITAYDDFIQTDAAINRGNSGGALVDVEGRLVGINTAIVSSSGGSQGVGLAIPINQAISVMQRLVNYGRVVRGFLGVTVETVKAEHVKFYELKDSRGALVSFVKPGGPAEKAGLKKGDIIIALGEVAVKDHQHLRRIEAKARPGAKTTVTVIRAGKEQTLAVALTERPDAELTAKAPKSTIMKSLLRTVKVTALSPAVRARLNAPPDLEGAVVESLDPDSPAARAGLHNGDVIREINRHEIKNAAAAIDVAGKIKAKEILLYVWSKGRAKFIIVRRRR